MCVQGFQALAEEEMSLFLVSNAEVVPGISRECFGLLIVEDTPSF